MMVLCPACNTANRDDRFTCWACHYPIRRRRALRDTTPLAPETVQEEITARLRALPKSTGRVVYTWPDEPCSPDEDTQV